MPRSHDSAYPARTRPRSRSLRHRATELGIVRTKAHAVMRDEQSRAAMERLHAWLLEQDGHHLPKGPMGKAVSYALNNWEHLTVFLNDVRVPVRQQRE
jgi:transposase